MAKPPHFIRQWRLHRRLTLEQLAERIGMTHQNLGKIERFLVPYNQPLLDKLAEELGTDQASLIMRDPSDPDAVWSLWDSLKPAQQTVARRLLRSLRDEDVPVDVPPSPKPAGRQKTETNVELIRSRRRR